MGKTKLQGSGSWCHGELKENGGWTRTRRGSTKRVKKKWVKFHGEKSGKTARCPPSFTKCPKLQPNKIQPTTHQDVRLSKKKNPTRQKKKVASARDLMELTNHRLARGGYTTGDCPQGEGCSGVAVQPKQRGTEEKNEGGEKEMKRCTGGSRDNKLKKKRHREIVSRR